MIPLDLNLICLLDAVNEYIDNSAAVFEKLSARDKAKVRAALALKKKMARVVVGGNQ